MTDDSQHRATLTALLSAQRKLRRIEAILQAMQWNGRGLGDPYANWLRGQLELALEPEDGEEAHDMTRARDAFRRWAKDKTLTEVLKYSHGDTFMAGYEAGEAEREREGE